MLAEVSDAGGFRGGGGLSVGERVSGRYGRIGFVSTGRVDAVGLEFGVDLTEAQMRALVGGDRVPLSNDETLTYPVSSLDGRPAGVARQILSLRLQLLPGRSMLVALELGAIVGQQGAPSERPPTAHAHMYGAMGLGCEFIAHRLGPQSSIPASDPNFESTFCRTALRDYGLEPIARHLEIPVLAP